MSLGFRDWGFGFGVWVLRFRIWDLGFGFWGLEFGVWGLGFRVWGSGLIVSGLCRTRKGRRWWSLSSRTARGSRRATRGGSGSGASGAPSTPAITVDHSAFGVSKAHRLVYHSTLGWRVIKKKFGVQGVQGSYLRLIDFWGAYRGPGDGELAVVEAAAARGLRGGAVLPVKRMD